MKIWMVSLSYVPMGISAMTSRDELHWAWPVYLYTAIAVLVAMGILYLMTMEPRGAARVHARENARDMSPLQSSEELSTPLMQMMWQAQGGSP